MHPMVTSKLWLCLILGFGLVVLGLGMIRGESSIATYFELERSEEILLLTVNNLELENRQLALEIMKIKKSGNYARKILRDKYHVTDANERIVFVGD